MIRRFGKSGKITRQNIRPYIFSAELLTSGEQDPALRLLLQVGSKGGVSPSRFLEQLALKGITPGENIAGAFIARAFIFTGSVLLIPFRKEVRPWMDKKILVNCDNRATRVAYSRR